MILIKKENDIYALKEGELIKLKEERIIIYSKQDNISYVLGFESSEKAKEAFNMIARRIEYEKNHNCLISL